MPSIELVNGTASEQRNEAILRDLLKQERLDRWIFTDRVRIDENTGIPHSHPILTLNTRDSDPDLILSVFVHENLHWFLDANEASLNAAVEDLKRLYPKVPVGGTEGARSTFSTYMHLINCWLEIEGVRDVAGQEAADKAWNAWSRHHYTWIYDRVRRDHDAIGAIIRKHGLYPQAGNSRAERG